MCPLEILFYAKNVSKVFYILSHCFSETAVLETTSYFWACQAPQSAVAFCTSNVTGAFLWHTIYLQIHKEISEVAPMGFFPLQYLA